MGIMGLIAICTISFTFIIANATAYHVRYIEVPFVSEDSTPQSDTISAPEPVNISIVHNSDGSINASIVLFETLTIRDGGGAIREDQGAAERMILFTEIYSIAYENLEPFEDVAKGDEKIQQNLEWIAHKTGISKIVALFERIC